MRLPGLFLWLLLLCAAPALAGEGRSAASSPAVIPRRLSPAGHFVVPVQVNGQGPYAFIVDTAASRTVISPALAQALHLPLMEDRVGNLAGAGGATLTAVFQIGSLRFAGHEWAMGPALALPPGGTAPEFAGILGLDVLARRILLFDFAAGELRLMDVRQARAERRGKAWYRLGARRNFAGFLIVDGRVGGKRVKVVIDTGARRSIGNARLGDLLDDLSPASIMAPEQIITGLNLPQTRARTGTARQIAMGRLRWHDASLLVADLAVFKTLGLDKAPALVLGLDFFQNTKAVMIDFSRQRLWIEPYPDLQKRHGIRARGSREGH